MKSRNPPLQVRLACSWPYYASDGCILVNRCSPGGPTQNIGCWICPRVALPAPPAGGHDAEDGAACGFGRAGVALLAELELPDSRADEVPEHPGSSPIASRRPTGSDGADPGTGSWWALYESASGTVPVVVWAGEWLLRASLAKMARRVHAVSVVQPLPTTTLIRRSVGRPVFIEARRSHGRLAEPERSTLVRR